MLDRARGYDQLARHLVKRDVVRGLLRVGAVVDEAKLQALVAHKQLHRLYDDRRDFASEAVERCLDERLRRSLRVAKSALSELQCLLVSLLDHCLVVLELLQAAREGRSDDVVR